MAGARLLGSSYRLQFNRRFTFAEARALVPYLHALGITECYTSPLLKSKPGSEHGYDIVDHGALDPELGSREEFDALASALRTRDMGLILDFVPNHMGLDPVANPWWRDVLEYGRESPYAEFFDIDWEPIASELRDRLLLPILESGYGEVLERGELRVGFANGAFEVHYGDRRLPIAPHSTHRILERQRPAIEAIASVAATDRREYAEILALLDPAARGDADRRTASQTVKARLAGLAQRSPAVGRQMEQAAAAFEGVPGEPSTFDPLHALLDEQVYRLAHWKTAFDEINYRRFFDINELGGVRMEDPRVFDAAHRLVLRLIADGIVTGVRLDHPDGLFDPGAYFERLQQAAAGARSLPPPAETASGAGQRRPLHLLAEKILAVDEHLPESWPISGTTGYGFLNGVHGLFVDRDNRQAVERIYARLTGRRELFPDTAYHAKRLMMASSMASELAVLTRALKQLAAADRATRDYTMNALRQTVEEIVACLPVYRTYVSTQGCSARDREVIDFAVDHARRRNTVVPSALFLFVRNVLVSEGPAGETGRDEIQARRRRFAMKFQQFSAPVQAKGVEDTAFYRHNALVSLNEVGANPGLFGGSLDEFHAGNRVRLERWPLEMTATATHDTKRGEDSRTRIDVISEIPTEWRHAVLQWMATNAPRRTVVDRGPAPDRNDEYAFYQALVGVWPAEPMDAPLPTEAPPALVARVRRFMQKAIKEAKLHTSWISPDTAYEDAVVRFVDGALSGTTARAFLAAFVPVARRLAVGGAVNSLAQLVLKIASPGVPDVYQGTEDWQLVLADPDNRGEVDFDRRRTVLDELMPWIERAEAARSPRSARASSARVSPAPDRDALELAVEAWLDDWSDGRIKTFLTACGLRFRRDARALFIHGAYEPLAADGPRSSQLVAFARVHEAQTVIALVPRLMSRWLGQTPRFGPDVWGDTRVAVPGELADDVRHVFTGARVPVVRDERGAWIRAADAFRTCPVALLWNAGTR